MATIRDVAKLAGVSVATVSRVLNKKGYVHEDTVKQVEQAIEQLKYKPNAVAKALFKKSSTMIAVLLSGFERASFSSILTSIENSAYEAGYQVIIGDVQNRKSYMDVLLQNNIAGILMSQEVHEQVKDQVFSIPIVVLDGQDHDRLVNYEGSRLAIAHLLEEGCCFPAFIKGGDSAFMNERYEAFLDVAEENGVPYRVIESRLSVADGERAALELLQKAPYIDGICACSDEVAIGVLRAAHQLRIQVPEQLKVIGFGAIPEGEYVYPSLTTISKPQTGEREIKELIQKMQGKPVLPITHQPAVEIVERESTKIKTQAFLINSIYPK
ncbi:LacI family DNA-binding transcriptional regulator [Ectobacillus panaciterrae]|uniref:LacI family DNA-binding transcriptional regulator n=1 Tax=Ectobacillus panaciterrae TaxID=363872 RepID=UPI0004287B52|nr:LacI family DNA-binding transcriptional regulator [Ectobacillus panaciterrae]